MYKKKVSNLITILGSISISILFGQLQVSSSTVNADNKPINHFISQQNGSKNLYGSIAVFGYGSYSGFSWNYSSRQEAVNAALKACFESSRGKCRTAIWFRNGCGALATSLAAYGAAYHSDELTAQYNALERCGNKFCRIKKVVCNDTK